MLKTVAGKSLAFRVTHDQKVAQLKTSIYDREKVQEEQPCLVFNGRNAEDRQQLVDLGVSPGTTIRLLYRLRGGLSEWTREGQGYGRERPTPGSESSNPRISPGRGERGTQRPQGPFQQAVKREGEIRGLPEPAPPGVGTPEVWQRRAEVVAPPPLLPTEAGSDTTPQAAVGTPTPALPTEPATEDIPPTRLEGGAIPTAARRGWQPARLPADT